MMQPRRYPRIIKHRMANLGIYPYAQDGPRIMHFVRRAQSYHQTLVRQSITLTQTLKRCVDLETKLDEAQERLQQLRANQPAAMVDDKGVVWRTSLKLPEIPPVSSSAYSFLALPPPQHGEVMMKKHERDAAIAKLEAEKALKEAQEQEPVAYMIHEYQGTGEKRLQFQPHIPSIRDDVTGPIVTALYARPVPAAPAVAVPAVPEEWAGEWLHKSGRAYRVIAVANTAATDDRYPLTIVYQDDGGRTWSRLASDWHGSMTRALLQSAPQHTTGDASHEKCK